MFSKTMATTDTNAPPRTGRKRRRAPRPVGRAAALASYLLLTSSDDCCTTPTAMHYAEAAAAGARAADRAPPSLRKNNKTRAGKGHGPPAGSAAGERIAVVVQPENIGAGARGPQHLIPDSARSAEPQGGTGGGGGGGARGWSRPTFDGYGSGRPGLLPLGTAQRQPGNGNKDGPRKNNRRTPTKRGGVEATFDEWMEYQNEMNANALGDASANNVLSYDEWIEAQSQSARRGSAAGQPRGRRSFGDAASYEEWLEAQSGNVQAAVAGYGSSSSGQADYETWLKSQSEAVSSALGDAVPSYDEWLAMQQQSINAMGSSQTNVSREDFESWLEAQSQLVASGGTMGSSPAADVDTVGGQQVILRPRLADGPELALPALGSSGSATSPTGDRPTVYYYDPAALSASSGTMEGAPELTLPTVVYDASGRPLSMASVHAGGRNQVFLEVRPRSSSAWGDGIRSQVGSLSEKLNLSGSSSSSGGGRTSSSSSGGGGGGGSDQLIVLVTVATTAVVVGMLAARRLKTRRLLEDCLGLEDDEGGAADDGDRVRRDKKYDADTGLSVAGSSAAGGSGFLSSDGLMGGRGAGGYYGTATPGNGSGLHWRGDSEKFDV